MRIVVDLRSLQSGTVSGVENYTINLLEHLLALDKKNQYTLFFNSRGKQPEHNFDFLNSKIVSTKIPNKLLNLGLKFNTISLERFAGDFDCLFMPNLNQFNIAKNKKLIITVHDLSPLVTPEFYNFKRNLWHHFLNYRSVFKRADLIFAVSKYTKLDLIRLFQVSPEKIRVAYPGVDIKTFNPDISLAKLRETRNFYGLPGDYFLFLNTIEPRKNLAGLIAAFENLKHPAFLVIAGKKGWKYKKVFKLIEENLKKHKIKYIGYVKEEHKAALIKMAKALVYPSFYEGFGFQPLEAMACGVPVIVSQITALPEVVGSAGILIDPYDKNSIIRALETALLDKTLKQRLVLKGKQQALNFNWKLTASQVLEGLESV